MSPIQLANDIDIFRKTQISDHSPEHVLQAGLGGKLEVRGLIDKVTNEKLGGTIDRALLEDFELLRALLGLEKRRGGPIHVASEKGDYDLLGDKPIEKSKGGTPWKVTTMPDGGLNIAIRATSIERTKELALHARRATGVEGRPIRGLKAKRIQTYPPAIPFVLSVGGQLQLRAIAKCCLNYVAYTLGPAVALDDCFNGLRTYVLEGVDEPNLLGDGKTGDSDVPLLANFDFRSKPLFKPFKIDFGPVDHRFVIRGCKNTKTAYATVELFGAIPFSILLSSDWTRDDFCYAFVTDPRPGGKWESAQLPFYARPEKDSVFILEHSLDAAKLQKQLTALVDYLQKQSLERADRQMITEALQTAIGEPDGAPFTQAKAGRLAQELAARFVSRELRLTQETPITPPKIE